MTPTQNSTLTARAASYAPSRDRLARTVADLCALGEKVSGTPEEQQACDYLTAQLRAMGVSYKVHRFDSYISYPTATTLTLLVPEARDIPAVGVAFTRDTGAAGIEADIVWAGAGGPEQYADLDARGKIALIDKLPTYGLCEAARKAGAAALVGMSSGPQRHKMTCSPIWGAPASKAEVDAMPAIAGASINRPDGEWLRQLAQRGGARGRLVARVDTRWREVLLPVAEIPGTEPEFLLMGAHYCTWFDGATDNIGAVAILLELARLFQGRATPPRHGIRLAWWPGHTHGRYAGSAWYADEFWHELNDRAIAYFNVDINGSRRAYNKALRNQTGEAAAYTAAVMRDVLGEIDPDQAASMQACLRRPERYVHHTRPHRASDQSFWGVGLSGLQVSSFLQKDDPDRLPNSGLARWWHAEEDTVENCDPDVLLEDARLHAQLVHGLVDAAVLPLDLLGIAGDVDDALREYAEAAPELRLLDEIAAAVQRFRGAAQRFHAAGARLDPADTAATAAWNRRLLRAIHGVNPAVYLLGSPFQQDRATGSRLLPGFKPLLDWQALSTDERRMLRVALRREVNRLVHALDEARRVIET
ncbi:M28 family peptidase [Achromobacter aloeverae]|uniref:Peptidase M28 domain-containing protein n=1 Tax=Achromobacter aloeverae TaxID=1750518 RepID=A0A4Q1HFF0_9BURK|nr:M28 family peptidase [Achromobacter aloeverae]RXN85413.1 hypothetical protein C7R54_23300 [Achromobacter aloeverae]